MNETIPKNKIDERLEAAFRQVGKFLYHFSLLEQEINEGIGKVLRISAGSVDVIAANMDFIKKLNLLRCAELIEAAMPDDGRKKTLKKTFDDIEDLNRERNIAVHSPFACGEKCGSVKFRRATAKDKLKVEPIEWNKEKFQQLFEKAESARAALHKLIEEMKPYEPSLDFSDPRNSEYIGVIL
jgi:hypothetical protein